MDGVRACGGAMSSKISLQGLYRGRKGRSVPVERSQNSGREGTNLSAIEKLQLEACLLETNAIW